MEQYTILSSSSKEKLIEKVNILMKLGWYPIGGAFKDDKVWHQTMQKYNEMGLDDDDGDNGGDDDQPPEPVGGSSGSPSI